MNRPRKPVDGIGLITRRTRGILVAASIMTLIGLTFMIWSMAQPTPMPVILAMSVGQVLGILAFLLFGVVVLVDQLRRQREAGAHDAAARSDGLPEAAPDELPVPAARSDAAPREASP